MSTSDFQLSPDAAEEKAAARADLKTRFERRDFPAPYDTADDTKEGTVIHGWVCPACGDVTWNDFLLDLNHGYQTYDPNHWPGKWAGAQWGETCNRLITREYRIEHGLPVYDEAPSLSVPR